MANAANEKSIFFFLLGAVIFHAVVISMIHLIGWIAKLSIFSLDEKRTLRSLWSAVKLFFNRFISYYTLFLLIFISFGLVTILIHLLGSLPGGITAISVVLIFMVQQFYLWFRNLYRIFFIASLYRIFSNRQIK
jgi:hypothetical protein